MSTSRRDVLKLGALAAAGSLIPLRFGGLPAASAEAARLCLSDPALQPKFVEDVPNALDPGFIYDTKKGKIDVSAGPTWHRTGLLGPTGARVWTPVWGYGDKAKNYSWPGRTFQVKTGEPLEVTWKNDLKKQGHLLTSLDGESVIDTSTHWAYSLPGYEGYSVEEDGTPLVAHLHGGHTDATSDGNPEYFFGPGFKIRGPRWVDKKYQYANDQPAGNLWYHDHALGLTRLNVYAGLAGFYFIRDDQDTGEPDNPLGLPAFPYEAAYAIQDRMFKENGELFCPAFPGDPFYDEFIAGQGVVLPPEVFGPNAGPTALAEFFGDHMVVNGKLWPKAEVEPRNYRLRLLNGSDSRFMVLRFRPVPAGATDLTAAGAPLPMYVIGSDQGLASSATLTDRIVFEPGARYDVVFDFSQVAMGTRVIMENIAGDAPFGGDYDDALSPDDFFPDRQTDRIMAFDVTRRFNRRVPDRFNPATIAAHAPNTRPVDRVRRVALFEGMDEFGRLQPLLGTAEPATDQDGNDIVDPDTGLPFEGSIAWHSPITEIPTLGSTEVWEIYNATGDAHPVHLHLVHFDVLDRNEFTANVIPQAVRQHDGSFGTGFSLADIAVGAPVPAGSLPGYIENAPKDMVIALPGQVTRIKATFDKPGRYVWHCHILSHEDHEMMRPFEVRPATPPSNGGNGGSGGKSKPTNGGSNGGGGSRGSTRKGRR